MYNFFYHIWCFLKGLWKYIRYGLYIPKTEYNVNMFNYYASVAADETIQPDTPAEHWTEQKLRNAFFEVLEDATEEQWQAARQCIYTELTTSMMQMLWLDREED